MSVTVPITWITLLRRPPAHSGWLQGVARVSACRMWMMTRARSAISVDGSRGEAASDKWSAWVKTSGWMVVTGWEDKWSWDSWRSLVENDKVNSVKEVNIFRVYRGKTWIVRKKRNYSRHIWHVIWYNITSPFPLQTVYRHSYTAFTSPLLLFLPRCPCVNTWRHRYRNSEHFLQSFTHFMNNNITIFALVVCWNLHKESPQQLQLRSQRDWLC